VSVNALSTAEAKNLFLDKLNRRIDEDSPRYITVSYLASLCQENLTLEFSEVIIGQLVADGFVIRGDNSPKQKGRVSITSDGIDFVRSNRRFSEYPDLDIQNWRQSPNEQALSNSTTNQVTDHLGRCIILINASEFSQQDKAQIVGLLKICQQIVELPEPKIGLLRRVLGWLKEIKELAPLIELIFKLVGRN
jgi:hypothetical protein